MYVKRNSRGEIELASRHVTPDCTEYLSPEAGEWRAFLNSASDSQTHWQDSDRQLIRVLEDLIDALVASETLNIEMLPEAARRKLADRRLLRYQQQVEKAQIELHYEEQH